MDFLCTQYPYILISSETISDFFYPLLVAWLQGPGWSVHHFVPRLVYLTGLNTCTVWSPWIDHLPFSQVASLTFVVQMRCEFDWITLKFGPDIMPPQYVFYYFLRLIM